MKRIIFVLMALCLSAVAMAKTSGRCGDNLNWSYDAATTTLTITGTGEMYNFRIYSAPWDAFSANITTVNLPDGLTAIGGYAFCSCKAQIGRAHV